MDPLQSMDHWWSSEGGALDMEKIGRVKMRVIREARKGHVEKACEATKGRWDRSCED